MRGTIFFNAGVVLLTMGLIVVFLPNLFASIEQSKLSGTVADIRAIGTGLGSYMVDYQFFPQTHTTGMFSLLDSLGYYSGNTTDGWGQQFIYLTGRLDEYSIWSYGKDKKFGATGEEFSVDMCYHNGQFSAPAVLVGDEEDGVEKLCEEKI